MAHLQPRRDLVKKPDLRRGRCFGRFARLPPPNRIVDVLAGGHYNRVQRTLLSSISQESEGSRNSCGSPVVILEKTARRSLHSIDGPRSFRGPNEPPGSRSLHRRVVGPVSGGVSSHRTFRRPTGDTSREWYRAWRGAPLAAALCAPNACQFPPTWIARRPKAANAAANVL